MRTNLWVDPAHGLTPHMAELTAALRRAAASIPQADLDLLRRVELGDTGQSRTCRNFLCLLVVAKDPTGFEGEGLLEMRTLDVTLAGAYPSSYCQDGFHSNFAFTERITIIDV